MLSVHASKRLLSALFAGALLLQAIPVGAVPARMLTQPLPPASAGAESCTPPVHRTLAGPGRRPGATIVPVTLRLEVMGSDGKFAGASSDHTRAAVASADVLLRASISNLSLYDVANVRIKHTFTSSNDGPRMDGIGGVEGATFDERTQTFTVDGVESDATATFTFHLFLTGQPQENLLQSQIRLENFEVTDSERRHPVRYPETSIERVRQTVAKLGIGTTDVACFTGPTEKEPIFPATGDLSKIVSVEKSANVSEVQPGSQVTYTITVMNRSGETLREVLVDDRFSSSQLKIVDAGGGERLASGLQWSIDALEPGGRFVARYRTEVLSGVSNGDRISNTTLVASRELLGTPTTKRTATAVVSVLGNMPRTGVELRWLTAPLQVLLGSLLALLLFRIALSVVLLQTRGRGEE